MSGCMEEALCLKPSRRSLAAETRNWRLIVAVVVVEKNYERLRRCRKRIDVVTSLSEAN